MFDTGLYPGENDGYMTMVYHGLPWTTMVFHGHTTMVNHGRPCFVKWPPMVDHGQRSLSNNMVDHGPGPWLTMVDHGQRPWLTMVKDHGQP